MSVYARYLVGHDTLGWTAGAAWTYALPDALGSVRQEVDAAGALLDARAWTPYGIPWRSQGKVDGPQSGLGYTGEWFDAVVGLEYLRARWYDAGAGRFTQVDPWEGDSERPQTLFPSYAYAINSPVNYTDPSGHIYNRSMAVNYALNHWHTYNTSYVSFASDCTNFASQALWEGGLRDPRPIESVDRMETDDNFWEVLYWERDVALAGTDGTSDRTWVSTPHLYKFLTEVLHFPTINYGERYGDQRVPYVNGYPKSGDDRPDNSNWIEFLGTHGAKIKPGDLVFYWQSISEDSGWAPWTHVSMVVGWGKQTYFPEGNPTAVSPVKLLSQWQCIGTQKPLVVEHSTDFATNKLLPRSIDNTGSPAENISVVLMQTPFTLW